MEFKRVRKTASESNRLEGRHTLVNDRRLGRGMAPTLQKILLPLTSSILHACLLALALAPAVGTNVLSHNDHSNLSSSITQPRHFPSYN